MLTRRGLGWAGLGLALRYVGEARASDVSVVVVTSESTAPYQQAGAAILDELGRGGVSGREVLQMTAVELVAAAAVPVPRLYIALGTEAASLLARSERRVPVLCALLPQRSFERVLYETGRRASAQFSALYLNQSFTRQLDLIQLALPRARRLGVLLGADSFSLEGELDEVTHSRDMTLVSERVTPQEPLYTGLSRVLADSDVLLALADPQIYNSGSIQNILMASFRAQIPLIGFSPAYVRAGAVMAVYSTPEQIGRQAGELARGVLQGRNLPAPLYPRDFSVIVNDQVSRSLGLSLDSQALSERLHRLETRR